MPSVLARLTSGYDSGGRAGGGGDLGRGGNPDVGIPGGNMWTPPAAAGPSGIGRSDWQLPERETPPDWSYEGFVPPTADSLQQDPGFQARIRESQRALQHSAAARGSYFTPNTLEQLMGRAGEMASDEYGNAWNRGMGQWQSGFNAARTKRLDDFGINESLWNSRQTNRANEFGIDDSLWGRGRTTKLDDFGIFDRNRNFDWTRDQDLWGRRDTDRRFAHGVDQDLWGRGRTDRLDDFGMWHTMDTDFWNRNKDLSDYGYGATG